MLPGAYFLCSPKQIFYAPKANFLCFPEHIFYAPWSIFFMLLWAYFLCSSEHIFYAPRSIFLCFGAMGVRSSHCCTNPGWYLSQKVPGIKVQEYFKKCWKTYLNEEKKQKNISDCHFTFIKYIFWEKIKFSYWFFLFLISHIYRRISGVEFHELFVNYLLIVTGLNQDVLDQQWMNSDFS